MKMLNQTEKTVRQSGEKFSSPIKLTGDKAAEQKWQAIRNIRSVNPVVPLGSGDDGGSSGSSIRD